MMPFNSVVFFILDAIYIINPWFEQEYDAWDGKNENTRFFVGKTSQTLRYVVCKTKKSYGMLLR